MQPLPCTSLIFYIHVMLNWHLSNKVSTEQYSVTISRAQVYSSSRSRVFKLTADQVLVLIGHVQYINILTWLRGFQVKILYLVLFSLFPSLFWELRDKRNMENFQFWPESLGPTLEYWYIERGLLDRSCQVNFLKTGQDCSEDDKG